MTIQEMFNLLLEYQDAVIRVNNIPVAKLGKFADDPDIMGALQEEYRVAEKVYRYRHYFSPMHCKHCFHNHKCKIEDKREFGKDFCSDYQVELNEA